MHDDLYKYPSAYINKKCTKDSFRARKTHSEECLPEQNISKPLPIIFYICRQKNM